jgi:hypothetical protein
MNKLLVTLLIIGLLAIVGFGIYQLISPANSNVPTNTVPIAAGTGGEGSFTTPAATGTPAAY